MLSSAYSQYQNNLNSHQLRSPRAIVLINDIQVDFVSIEVTTTTFYMSDNYHLQLSLASESPILSISYLFSAQKLNVKIYMGFPLNPNAYNTNDLDLLIVGDCDNMRLDPINQMIQLSGRDLTSRLIDTKTYEKYSNKTASDIAIILANKHGLNPVVTPTTQKAGIFYKYQNTLLIRETTEWDLIVFLAQQQDFAVYVEKENLIFAPRQNDSATPYLLPYTKPATKHGVPQFPGMYLDFQRSFTLASDVVVKIRVPYSTQDAKAFTVKATSKHRNYLANGLQTYVYTIAGLSKSQALAKAQSILRDITQFEIRLTATMPGDNVLRKNSLIKLIGVDVSLDQQYYADEVRRTFSFEDGYNMHISAKNHSVDSQVIL